MAAQKQPDGFFPNVVAGGIAGGIAAVITSPLEVIKTRLQSSTLYHIAPNATTSTRVLTTIRHFTQCTRDIYRIEGMRAFAKGLGVTLSGVIPSRAVYFTAYTQGKKYLSQYDLQPVQVHLISSTATGLINVTWANPLYVIRTRQQLRIDSRGKKLLSFWQCTKDTYLHDGVPGFFRGISASYAGILETVLALVLYEQFKQRLCQPESQTTLGIGVAAATAKCIATFACYPHEVVRTRLRETSGQHRKYTGFWQTLNLTYREEGVVMGLYRGFVPHLLRVVPNHAIMFLIFERTVSLLNNYQSTSKVDHY